MPNTNEPGQRGTARGPSESSAGPIGRLEELAGRRQWLQLQDEAQAALRSDPGNRRLIHLRGLALANAGALDEAEALIRPHVQPELERPGLVIRAAELLHALATPGREPERRASDLRDSTEVLHMLLAYHDPRIATEATLASELLGLYGRIQKDRWARGGSSKQLEEAYRAYRLGYDRSESIYLGINAASVAWLLGRHEDANQLARRVLTRAEKLAESEADYWGYATQGEAWLLLGDSGRARSAFERALASARVTAQQRDSTGRQLRLLAQRGLPVPPDLLEPFRAPQVLALLSGTGSELSVGAYAHWSTQDETVFRDWVASEIDPLGECIAYCSALPGPDLVFSELMLECGFELNLVLPCETEEFLRRCVRPAGRRWEYRLRAALGLAETILPAIPERLVGDHALLAHSGRILLGRALLRCEEFGATPVVLEYPEASGAARALRGPRTRGDGRDSVGRQVEGAGAARSPSAPRAREGRAADAELGRRVVATLLFSDLRGYSRLKDEHYLIFLEFSRVIGGFLRETPWRPDFLRTTGDGLFAVCGTENAPGSAARMARFALQLQDAVRAANQRVAMPDGLPMEMRVALHAAPIFTIEDPFTCFADYFGSNVNRTARLEPVTVPGRIYVTEQFASLFSFETGSGGEEDLAARCELVGEVDLAKGFGVERVFLLQAKGARAIAAGSPG